MAPPVYRLHRGRLVHIEIPLHKSYTDSYTIHNEGNLKHHMSTHIYKTIYQSGESAPPRRHPGYPRKGLRQPTARGANLSKIPAPRNSRKRAIRCNWTFQARKRNRRIKRRDRRQQHRTEQTEHKSTHASPCRDSGWESPTRHTDNRRNDLRTQ